MVATICAWVDILCFPNSALAARMIPQWMPITYLRRCGATILSMDFMITIGLRDFVHVVCGHLLAPFSNYNLNKAQNNVKISLLRREFFTAFRP